VSESKWSVAREKHGQLSCIIVRHAQVKPDCFAVFCHGFGAPGDDLFGLADWMLDECEKLDVVPLLLFPAAPIDLADEGMPGGRAWWRLNMAKLMQASMTNSFDEIRNEVPDGLEAARLQLEGAINSVRAEFDLQDTPFLLGGFSQGAMLTVETVLRSNIAPPQAMALYSGALICESHWQANVSRLAGVNAFQSHGRLDPILPIQTGKWLSELISPHCAKYHWHEFSGPHTIPPESIRSTCELMKSISADK
jgi:phospholipase/carboxylesterase